MRIAILGANGFIGRYIVAEAAARHGGEAVLAMGRRRVDPALFPAGVEQRICDVTHGATAANALHDVTHIINCVMGSREAIVGSAIVAAGMAEHRGLERLVHLSSIAVHGARQGLVPEDAAPGIAEDAYGAAKIEAESHIAGSVAHDRAILIRPGLVYGPGSKLWTDRIARLLMAGRLGHMGRNGLGTCNLVHVEDVARACVRACGMPLPAEGRAFHLVAPDPPDWNGYLTDFAGALGMAPRSLSPMRLGVERLAAYPLQLWKRYGDRRGRASPAMITPGLARLFSRATHYDNSGAGKLMEGQWHGYRQGLEESARWVHAVSAKS